MSNRVWGVAGAGVPVVRDHNAALVLDLVRREDGISRVEVAERTGLTPQAISKIVNRLRAEGFVTEAGRVDSTGGKPRTRLRLVPGARCAVGVHLDRTATTVLLTDLSGRPTARRHVPDGMTSGTGRAVESVVEQVRAVLAGVDPGHVLGVGIACPGPLDHAAGVLRQVTGQPAWDGYALRAELAARLDLPVVLDKDTDAAAVAECLAAGSTADSFACVYHGPGLGAGLVLDGRLRRGRRGDAGEFGHQVLQVGGPPCPCGARGCLEALCGVALATGDLRGAARLVGIAAANLVRLLDVERIVLAGPVVLADPGLYVAEVSAAIRGHLPEPDRQTVAVGLAEGGADAVALGAAGLLLAPLYGTAGGPVADVAPRVPGG